jgi:predicted secreted protein
MLMRMITVAAAGLTVAAGANGSVLTVRDSGKTFKLRRGHELTLRLTERYAWTSPQVRGSSIRLTPVEYIRDPGFQEWRITAAAAGTARVSAVGTCPSCPTRRFRVVIVVR